MKQIEKNDEGKRLSLEYCRKKLNRNGKNFTDDEVKKIRTILYFFAEMECQDFLK